MCVCCRDKGSRIACATHLGQSGAPCDAKQGRCHARQSPVSPDCFQSSMHGASVKQQGVQKQRMVCQMQSASCGSCRLSQ